MVKAPKHLNSAKKAYDNLKFIHSRDGRILRIIAEYLYPEQHLKKHGINKTIIFFGSARTRSSEYLNQEISNRRSQLESSTPEKRQKLINEISKLEKKLLISKHYDEALQLSKMLNEWSNKLPKNQRFHICSGGGPGIMEAANRGAYESGNESIGFNISLPFEQEPNPYISPNLNFEFHYFFMRKFWLVFPSQCLIVFPGGFGTIDELMEVLTLRQTNKMRKPRLIVLYNEDYWKKIINFDALVEYGMIHPSDIDLFKFVNNPKDAFNYITGELSKNLNYRSSL